MSNPWFRAYSEMVDDEKLRLLAFEDRWHFVALLCCKNNGILESNDALMRRKVAVKLGLDLRELDEVARRLSEVGLIDQETLQPLKWKERQFQSDSSKERVRKFREKIKKQDCNDKERYRNVTVTAQEADTESETENNLINPNGLIVVEAIVDTQKTSKDKSPPCPQKEIIALYHEILPECPRVKEWSPADAASLRARWNHDPDRQNLEFWMKLFNFINKECDFLMGRVKNKEFYASLRWICAQKNFVKIMEGNYQNRS